MLIKEHLHTHENDLLLSEEFNTIQLRSDLLPWWYHTAAAIVAGLLSLAVGIIFYQSFDVIRLEGLLLDKPFLYSFMALIATCIWLVAGILAGWLRMRFALVNIYVPAGLLTIAFIYFGIDDLRNMQWTGSAIVFLITALLIVIAVRAFIIRKTWKYSLRKKPVNNY